MNKLFEELTVSAVVMYDLPEAGFLRDRQTHLISSTFFELSVTQQTSPSTKRSFELRFAIDVLRPPSTLQRPSQAIMQVIANLINLQFANIAGEIPDV